jgi:UPF0755 protein
MRILWFFISLTLLLVTALALPAWFLGYLDSPGTETLPFTVQRGENFSQIGGRLKAAGVIKHERALRWFVNFFPPAKALQRGEFGLQKNMPVPELIHALTEGKPLEYKVTIPEGYNLFLIAELLEAKGLSTKKDFLTAASSPEITTKIPTLREGEAPPSSIEGYIYPDTYLLQRVYSSEEIAKIFVTRFREVYKTVSDEIENSAITQEFKLTPHQVITFASIVEKETGAGSERPLVASVFVNRLRKRMRLQTDPTVIYGTWLKNGSWDGNIRRRDLNEKTPYNTYQIDGLPPGPIANPGLSSIKAVLNPASSDFLYFVSKNDGTHTFSKDYRDHQNAVKNLQLNRANKEGKSWRDLPEEQKAR